MKKIFLLILPIILALFIFCNSQFNTYCRVIKVISPIEIFIDLNNNFIFDEQKPVTIKDVYYLDKFINLYKSPLFNNLSDDEIFFVSYMSQNFASKTLSNKFVKVIDDEIYINNQKYSDILLNSHLFFDDSEVSQKNFLRKLKSYNLDDYVIYNTKSKKYHKLSCEKGRMSKNFVIIKKSELPAAATNCSYCYVQTTIGKNKSEIKIKNTFSSDNIKIFFLDLNTIFKPNNKCNTDACISLKNEINSAKKSIDFAVYGINNQDEIINSLVNAYKRGVKIRWVCDYDKKNINYYPDTIKLQKLIPNFKTDEIYDKNNTNAIMHNKFFIFDNEKVWTGSSNITGTDLTGFNANYSVLIISKQIANIYTKEFNQMFDGNFHTDKTALKSTPVNINQKLKIQPLFSPREKIINNNIIPLINNSKNYIYIPIFFLTHKDIAQALINAHKRGVEIKIINDATNAHTKHSVHKILRDSGIKVKTENYAGKMHTKSIFIDDYISVLGSMNFTKSAQNKNDENVLIIYNEEITRYLKQTFLYLWNKIPDKYEHYDPHAESKESIGSCFDGIDNDFDEKIDKDDEGCFIH